MESRWNDKEVFAFGGNELELRSYTSRLLGQESSLVLHGGGNTSLKAKVKTLFGESVDVLYIKGSGWDLQTIQPRGFSPVRMDVLHKLSQLEKLSDTDMVREQRAGMLDPSAPNPSVEAILHAIIPFKYVEHTHSDAVVAITNTPDGEKRIREVFGNRVLYVPYVMPGFLLARKIFELTRDVDWSKLEGLVLLNHGAFTFANEAKESYERMIQLVTEAERYIAKSSKFEFSNLASQQSVNSLDLAKLRKEISQVAGSALVASVDSSPGTVKFVSLKNVASIATRGTLTPDHVIHTKPKPMIFSGDAKKDLESFVSEYSSYFNQYSSGVLKILNAAPRWVVWPGVGTVSFGTTKKSAQIVSDISRATFRGIQWSEGMGGWKPLEESKLFEVEYWELEQAKVKRDSEAPTFQGKIALVTGAASGIGKATVEKLLKAGACVAGLDINSSILQINQTSSFLGLQCDVTNTHELKSAIEQIVNNFGGLDILVTNAGLFPPGKNISDLPDSDWDRSLAVNLTSHERLIKLCVPYLKLGIDPTIVVIASKNVPAPGPGAAAYSVAKAGLTQLARVAALELANENVRVNVLHPDAVFDTGVWTEEVLQNRANFYGLTVEQYKRKNLLKAEVTSSNVADLVCAVAGPAFAKTTGAQIPIDGGNDRVI